MIVKILTKATNRVILVLMMAGMIFLGYSVSLAAPAGCPCFSASIIDGAFAAAGPNSVEVHGDQTVDFYPTCDDYPNLAVAWIEAGPVYDLTFIVSSYMGGANPFCAWLSGDEILRVDNISSAEAKACRNEIVNSSVWELSQCPRGDTGE